MKESLESIQSRDATHPHKGSHWRVTTFSLGSLSMGGILWVLVLGSCESPRVDWRDPPHEGGESTSDSATQLANQGRDVEVYEEDRLKMSPVPDEIRALPLKSRMRELDDILFDIEPELDSKHSSQVDVALERAILLIRSASDANTDPAYRDRHGEAVRALSSLARSFHSTEAGSPRTMYKGVMTSCDRCHDEFRK